MINSDPIDSPPPALEPNTQSLKTNPQVSEPKPQQRGASTVALVIVLAFGMVFLVIKMGLTSIAWVIAALVPLALRLCRYLFPEPNPLLDTENLGSNFTHKLSIDPSGLTLTL